MTKETFRASVQYGDFKVTTQADDHGRRDFAKHLTSLGLVNEGGFLVGIEVWSGEVRGQSCDLSLPITGLLGKPGNPVSIKAAIDTGKPMPVRRVKLELQPDVFFGLFKRFSIALSSHGLIDGKEITYEE